MSKSNEYALPCGHTQGTKWNRNLETYECNVCCKPVTMESLGKTLYVVEYSGTMDPPTQKFFVRASDIGKAHKKGRELMGPGRSFNTRDPDRTEMQIAPDHEIHEGE